MSNIKNTGTVAESRVWTSERVKLAGLAGVIGGLAAVLLSLFAIVVGFPEPGAVGFVPFMLGLSVVYSLLFIALIGAHAHYRARYGRFGRAAVYLLGISLAGVAVDLALSALAIGFVPGFDPEGPIGTVLVTIATIAFLGTYLLASIVGVVFWRAGVDRLAAGVLVLSAPLLVGGAALLALNILGEGALVLEMAPYLGLAVLGYHLWSNSTGLSRDTDRPTA